jgi:2-dehydropantoate 2-reductase
MPRRFAVLGTGALGGFYGAKLQKAGHEVHFLVHSDYAHVRRQGLAITSKDGNFTLPEVNAYHSAADMPQCDVALIALKTTNNHLVPAMLPHVCAEKGTIVFLQNGFGEEERIAPVAGARKIIAGLCFICAEKTGPGAVLHTDYGYVRFAEYTGNGAPAGVTAACRNLVDDFRMAGIDADCQNDYLLARWRKLVWNIPFNGLSVVLNANTLQIISDSRSRRLVWSLMEEVVTGAAACGKTIPAPFIQEMITATEKMAPYFPSMKHDYDAGREMEIVSMYGNPLAAVKQKNMTLPKIQTLYDDLRTLENQNIGSS